MNPAPDAREREGVRPMPNSLENLSERELDALVNEHIFKICFHVEEFDSSRGMFQCTKCDHFCKFQKHEIPSYSSSISAAYSMETEIEKQGKYLIYIEELALVINGHWPDPLNLSELFRMVHASPRQRVLAALKTYGVQAPETKNV